MPELDIESAQVLRAEAGLVDSIVTDGNELGVVLAGGVPARVSSRAGGAGDGSAGDGAIQHGGGRLWEDGGGIVSG